MLMRQDRTDAATSEALHFAQSMLDGSSTAFYEVDGRYNLQRFLLSGVPEPFHRQYVEGMGEFDPQHPRHAGGLVVARLSRTMSSRRPDEMARYRAFVDQCGIVDMMDFFFRRDDQIVAGMSVGWSKDARIPDGVEVIAQKIHQYLQFNLVGRPAGSEDGQRYGLTSREMDVVRLLCCGRTNREIGEGLKIGQATVKTHLIHIFEKLGVETRSAVVALMARPN
ncbi:response regulator transcription factor [Bradyrhizobium sp. HKCCYLS20291]|uniref:helix-turn-helix transcriptional regulator n=1 Tax=Bradyrhizobium sp. HKCCYLS20291 TaxID=3420766 RepID=UPI003EB8E932